MAKAEYNGVNKILPRLEEILRLKFIFNDSLEIKSSKKH